MSPQIRVYNCKSYHHFFIVGRCFSFFIIIWTEVGRKLLLWWKLGWFNAPELMRSRKNGPNEYDRTDQWIQLHVFVYILTFLL